MSWTRSRRILLSLALFGCLAVPMRLRAAVEPHAIEAGRRATAYVVVESAKGVSAGSAFCVDASGVFVTSCHAIDVLSKDRSAKLFLIVAPGTKSQRIYTPTLVKADVPHDVAVLRIDRPGPLEAVDLASPAALAGLQQSPPVATCGLPLGKAALKKEDPPNITTSSGRVSVVRRNQGQVVAILFEPAVPAGNAGGPLIDEHGQVVGVVAGAAEGQQINSAAPVTFIRSILAQANIVLTPAILTNAAAANDLINWLTGDGKAGRSPPPSESAFQQSQKTLKDALSIPYADKSPAGKGNLILQLFGRAAASNEDPAACYAALVEAREQAVAAGDASAAIYAAELIAQGFAVKPATLMKDVIGRLNGHVTPAQDAASVAALGTMLAEAMARREEFAEMQKLLPIVRAAATASHNATVAAQTRDRLARLEAMAAEFDKVQAAQAKLAQAPNDSEANLLVGRYRCLIRGDFEKGMPLLAKGSDPALKAIALADLARPATPDAQKAAGDLWWDLAAKEAKNPVIADCCKARAGFWYQQALPKASGLLKIVLEKRLVALPATPGDESPGTDLLAKIDVAKDVTQGTMSRVENGLAKSGQEQANVRLGAEFPPEFDLDVTYISNKLPEREWVFSVFLPIRGEMHQFGLQQFKDRLTFGFWEQGQFLDRSSTATHLKIPAVAGATYSIVLKVRQDSVEGFLNGEHVYSLKNFEKLKLSNGKQPEILITSNEGVITQARVAPAR